MNQLWRKSVLTASKLFDLLVMALAFFLATVIAYGGLGSISLGDFLSMRIKVQNFVLFMGLLLIWHMLFSFFGMYRSRRLSDRWKAFVDILKVTSMGTGLLWLTSIMFRIDMITPSFLGVFWVGSSTMAMLSRLFLRYMLTRIRLRGRNLRFMLIVGTNSRAVEFARKIEARPALGYRLIGFFDEECVQKSEFYKNGYVMVGNLKDFPAFLRDHVVDEVVIALPVKSYYKYASLVAAQCAEQGVIVRYLSDIFNLKLPYSRTDYFEGEPLFSQYNSSIGDWPLLFKRFFDISISLILLLFLFPLLLFTAILIKSASPGPIFFIQERVGLNKRKFRLYKFRTMVKDAEQKQSTLEQLNEASGPVFKIKDDPRVTPLGRILRKTSIDEFPQLLNVVKGNMSLVGPRPLPVRDYDGFDHDWHRRRFSVRPGMTCLWQITGRSNTDFENWIKLDLDYIDNWSLWLDLTILARTIPAVLKGVGAA